MSVARPLAPPSRSSANLIAAVGAKWSPAGQATAHVLAQGRRCARHARLRQPTQGPGAQGDPTGPSRVGRVRMPRWPNSTRMVSRLVKRALNLACRDRPGACSLGTEPAVREGTSYAASALTQALMRAVKIHLKTLAAPRRLSQRRVSWTQRNLAFTTGPSVSHHRSTNRNPYFSELLPVLTLSSVLTTISRASLSLNPERNAKPT